MNFNFSSCLLSLGIVKVFFMVAVALALAIDYMFLFRAQHDFDAAASGSGLQVSVYAFNFAWNWRSANKRKLIQLKQKPKPNTQNKNKKIKQQQLRKKQKQKSENNSNIDTDTTSNTNTNTNSNSMAKANSMAIPNAKITTQVAPIQKQTPNTATGTQSQVAPFQNPNPTGTQVAQFQSPSPTQVAQFQTPQEHVLWFRQWLEQIDLILRDKITLAGQAQGQGQKGQGQELDQVWSDDISEDKNQNTTIISKSENSSKGNGQKQDLDQQQEGKLEVKQQVVKQKQQQTEDSDQKWKWQINNKDTDTQHPPLLKEQETMINKNKNIKNEIKINTATSMSTNNNSRANNGILTQKQSQNMNGINTSKQININTDNNIINTDGINTEINTKTNVMNNHIDIVQSAINQNQNRPIYKTIPPLNVSFLEFKFSKQDIADYNLLMKDLHQGTYQIEGFLSNVIYDLNQVTSQNQQYCTQLMQKDSQIQQLTDDVNKYNVANQDFSAVNKSQLADLGNWSFKYELQKTKLKEWNSKVNELTKQVRDLKSNEKRQQTNLKKVQKSYNDLRNGKFKKLLVKGLNQGKEIEKFKRTSGELRGQILEVKQQSKLEQDSLREQLLQAQQQGNQAQQLVKQLQEQLELVKKNQSQSQSQIQNPQNLLTSQKPDSQSISPTTKSKKQKTTSKKTIKLKNAMAEIFEHKEKIVVLQSTLKSRNERIQALDKSNKMLKQNLKDQKLESKGAKIELKSTIENLQEGQDRLVANIEVKNKKLKELRTALKLKDKLIGQLKNNTKNKILKVKINDAGSDITTNAKTNTLITDSNIDGQSMQQYSENSTETSSINNNGNTQMSDLNNVDDLEQIHINSMQDQILQKQFLHAGPKLNSKQKQSQNKYTYKTKFKSLSNYHQKLNLPLHQHHHGRSDVDFDDLEDRNSQLETELLKSNGKLQSAESQNSEFQKKIEKLQNELNRYRYPSKRKIRNMTKNQLLNAYFDLRRDYDEAEDDLKYEQHAHDNFKQYLEFWLRDVEKGLGVYLEQEKEKQNASESSCIVGRMELCRVSEDFAKGYSDFKKGSLKMDESANGKSKAEPKINLVEWIHAQFSDYLLKVQVLEPSRSTLRMQSTGGDPTSYFQNNGYGFGGNNDYFQDQFTSGGEMKFGTQTVTGYSTDNGQSQGQQNTIQKSDRNQDAIISSALKNYKNRSRTNTANKNKISQEQGQQEWQTQRQNQNSFQQINNDFQVQPLFGQSQNHNQLQLHHQQQQQQYKDILQQTQQIQNQFYNNNFIQD